MAVHLQNRLLLAAGNIHVRIVAQHLRQFHLTVDPGGIFLCLQHRRFRPESENDLFSFQGSRVLPQFLQVYLLIPKGDAAVFHASPHEIHRRLADKSGYEHVRRLEIQFIGRSHLLDISVLHHHDPVRQRHGFRLVVGHVDGRGSGLLVNLGNLAPHSHALFRVQVAQRLVHQENADFPDQRPSDGDALPLAAGKRPGQPIQVVRQTQDFRGLLHPLLDHVLVHTLQRQAEGDVVKNRHLRIQRVALENHRHFPVPGALLVGPHPVDQEIAAGNVLQPGDHPQRRGLSAAGGPDKNDKLTLIDFQVEIVHRVETVGVNLVDILQLNIHEPKPSKP